MKLHMVATKSPAPSTLWLSKHAHICTLNDIVIVLDLARDRYFSVAGPTGRALAAIVPGWPELHAVENASSPPDDCSESIARLVAQGILTSSEAEGKAVTPPPIESKTAQNALILNTARNRDIRFADIVNFLGACLSVVWMLRCRSLQSAIDALANKKMKLTGPATFDAALAADLIAVFRRLRSVTFNAHRRCLFHALVLMQFLSRYGVFPQFVMGVRINPWGAHSWVQSGEYVLDGTPEQVRFFTPILAV